MESLDELRGKWKSTSTEKPSIDATALDRIFRRRVNGKLKASMQYFWASLFLQILVYGMLTHVMVRYWGDEPSVLSAAAGIALYIPFTIVLLRKFKSLAIAKTRGESAASMLAFVTFQREQLDSFFRFKKRYELVLIPLSVAIGTGLTFHLFFPGGLPQYINGAIITFCISLICCIAAIVSENRRSFVQPLQELDNILKELSA